MQFLGISMHNERITITEVSTTLIIVLFQAQLVHLIGQDLHTIFLFCEYPSSHAVTMNGRNKIVRLCFLI